MIKNFIFFCGLPCSGKSTWLYDNYPDFQYANTQGTYFEKYPIVVSADEIKKGLDGYDPEHPELVHQESVDLSECILYDLYESSKTFDTVILDGGGINNNYNKRILNNLKKVHTTCVYFDTPAKVCIERLEKRERKVPVSDIHKKDVKMTECALYYAAHVDKFIPIHYFSNKYLFLDMDGTICSYAKAKRDENGNVDFVNGHMFKYLYPVQHIIDAVVKKYNMDNVFILTACANDIVNEDKKWWLKRWFPEFKIENYHWVGNKDYKHVFIDCFARYNKWNLNDICLIDDLYPTLDKCLEVGINAIHPSNLQSILNNGN